jgi:hypothetical protein
MMERSRWSNDVVTSVKSLGVVVCLNAARLSDSRMANDLQLLDTPTKIDPPNAPSKIEEPIIAKFAP